MPISDLKTSYPADETIPWSPTEMPWKGDPEGFNKYLAVNHPEWRFFVRKDPNKLHWVHFCTYRAKTRDEAVGYFDKAYFDDRSAVVEIMIVGEHDVKYADFQKITKTELVVR